MGVVADFVASLQAGVSVNAIEVETGCGANEIGVLKTSAVLQGRFFPEQYKVVIPEDVARVATSVVEDRVIISRMNTPALVGESGYVAQSHPNLFLPDRLWQTVPSKRPHSQRWLSYWLQHPIVRRLISAAATGTSNSMKNISKESVLSLPVPRTPFVEQQRIVAVLTVLDNKLDVIARQIEATRTLKRGLIQKLFSRGVGTQGADGRWVPHAEFKDSELGEIPAGWSAEKLNSHVSKVGSGVTPKGGSDSYLSAGIPLIRSQNVLVGRLSLDDVVFIPPEQHEKMRNSALVPNDVLLNITGASIGRCAVLPADFDEGNVNQHVCIIRPAKSLNPYFLCHYLNSDIGQKQIGKFQAGGNREGLNYQQIRSFDVPVPPISEQGEIAKFLGGVDKKIDVLIAKLEQYQTLKCGLMQKLLAGECRLKLEHNEPVAA
ncbi:restriction endonuclease subunit S [Paraburkholderia xenovorans]|nr:restriction endonuclease subunit S [Paraburkholderia xenovorans]